MSATLHLAHAATLAAGGTALSNTLMKVMQPLWASYRGERARCQLACKERRLAGNRPLLRSRCGDGDGHVMAPGWVYVESRAGLFCARSHAFLVWCASADCTAACDAVCVLCTRRAHFFLGFPSCEQGAFLSTRASYAPIHYREHDTPSLATQEAYHVRSSLSVLTTRRHLLATGLDHSRTRGPSPLPRDVTTNPPRSPHLPWVCHPSSTLPTSSSSGDDTGSGGSRRP